MEAVLCSKKRTDDYLWVINKVYCYESPKKELTFHIFEYLIYNLRSYNGVEI